MKTIITVIFISYFCINVAFAQTGAESSDFMRGAAIPQNLRTSLKTRLEQFTESIGNEQWETVSELLGDFRGRSGGSRYSAKQKKCLIDLIKSSPLLSFKPSRTSFTTAILSKPLSQKWWFINGTGEFKSESDKLSKDITITVYRDKSNWFISPGFYVGNWITDKISQTAESDFVKFIEVSQSPDSPVEIQNVSVKKFPESLLRKLTFDVFNKSAKTIDGVAYQIIGYGRTLVGHPEIIKPGEKISLEIDLSPSVIFCGGEQKQKLFIETVWFTDKTNWKLNRITKRES